MDTFPRVLIECLLHHISVGNVEVARQFAVQIWHNSNATKILRDHVNSSFLAASMAEFGHGGV